MKLIHCKEHWNFEPFGVHSTHVNQTGLEPVRKGTKEGRGLSVSVRIVLSSSGAVGVTLWSGELGVVGDNDK